MKGSRSKLILIFAGAVILLFVMILSLRSREPLYQGRPLTAWLEDVVAMKKLGVMRSTDIARRDRGEKAIKGMGPAAVPALARMMRTRDTTVRLNVAAFCAKRPWLGIKFRPPADTLQYWGTRGISILGPTGKAAIPELRNLLTSPHPHIRASAALALAQVGEAAAVAIPQITLLTSDSDPNVRSGACRALGDMGSAATSATAALVRCLQDTNDSIFSAALHAAGQIGVDQAVLIPVLTGQLAREDPRIRYEAATALGGCGGQARSATPQLLKAIHDPDTDVREAAVGALFKIDPGLAAQSSVGPPPGPAGAAFTTSVSLALQGPTSIALDIYKSITGMELVMDLPGQVIPGMINVRATRPLSPSEAAEFLEKALREQAGIVLERIDEKRVAVKRRQPKGQ